MDLPLLDFACFKTRSGDYKTKQKKNEISLCNWNLDQHIVFHYDFLVLLIFFSSENESRCLVLLNM